MDIKKLSPAEREEYYAAVAAAPAEGKKAAECRFFRKLAQKKQRQEMALAKSLRQRRGVAPKAPKAKGGGKK